MTTNKDIMKLFWREAYHSPRHLIFVLINIPITVTVGAFLGPYCISLILGNIQTGKVAFDYNAWLIVGFALTQLYGEFIGWRLNLYAVWNLETKAQRDLNQKVFGHLSRQSTNFHANRFGGSLVSQTNKLIGGFERFWDTIFFQLLPAATSILAATIILSFVFWQYALFLFILSIVMIIAIYFGSRYLVASNKAEAQAGTKLTGSLADAMTNILAIKSHSSESAELKHYSKLANNVREKSLINMWGFLKVSSVYATLTSLLNISAVVGALWAANSGFIGLSTIYLCVTYSFTVARQIWEMNNIMRNYNRVMGDAFDMVEILSISPEIKDPSSPEKSRISRGSIEFKNVTFTHNENNDPLFKGFDVRIKQGEKIGLVGHSGSGKTSLTKLLLRFSDIQEGTISIDGQDITTITQNDLRSHIAYVPQEPMLFHRSLEENISYGNPGASQQEVEGVAKLANAHEFIMKLPQKYKTLVGERGVKLSGGQRQRVAIARAMIKNAPILILDEATSALDSESESLIQEALWRLMQNRTAIVIAHRLSTIQKMDRIIVLDEGKIVEQGTHKELIRLNGNYAKLWAHQSGGFLDD